MQNLLRRLVLAVASLLLGSPIGAGVGSALAAEITQAEVSAPSVTACVWIIDNAIASDSPVLASDCGDRFGAYWHWNTTGVISGNGSTDAGSKCLKAKASGRVVVFDCKATFPRSGEIWLFRDGQVKVENGPLAGRCLDSRGNYGTTTADQLVVDICTGSSTQIWAIK
jgi:hypothetical protein